MLMLAACKLLSYLTLKKLARKSRSLPGLCLQCTADAIAAGIDGDARVREMR